MASAVITTASQHQNQLIKQRLFPKAAVFFDGNHSKEATLRYFYWLAEQVNEDVNEKVADIPSDN